MQQIVNDNHTPEAATGQADSDKKPKLPPNIIEALARIEPPERLYLQQRAIDLALAAHYGVRTVGGQTDPWTPEAFGIKGWKTIPFPALAFPYPFTRALLDQCVFRVRLRKSEKHVHHVDEGKEDETKTYPKCLASSGFGTVPYLVGSTEKLQYPSLPAFVFEAPAKALSWASALGGKAVCIGLGGVEAGAHDAAANRDSGVLRPHPLFEQLGRWKDRKVFIVMDAGRVLSPMVARGEARTVSVFQQLGAEVFIVPIPLHYGEDQGPDDWLAREVPTPEGDYNGPDVDLVRKRRRRIESLLQTAFPADPAVRASKVTSVEEARKLLQDLPFQASLAFNEESTTGPVARALRGFGVDKATVKAAIKAYRSALRRKLQKSQPQWKTSLSRTASGLLVAGAANVLAILRNDDRLAGVLGFDEFAQKPMVTRDPPWNERSRSKRALTDTDVVHLCEWMENEYRLRIAPKTLHPIVDARCREVVYHPVRDYLDSVKWDGEERVAGREAPGWLTVYFGAEDTPYVRLVGRLWLVCCVARIRKPGCKVDTMIILEGAQGLLKSSGLRVLGGDYFSDSLSDLGTKDSFGDLQGKWIIEMSELEAMTRTEATRTKHYMSKRSDYYRPPYGRLPVDVPRQCVFAGTTNTDEYLKDWTGGRRFWPVTVGQILLDDLRRDRDQLWAEADQLFRAGERYWVEDDDAIAMCSREQEARRIPLPYEDDVTELVEGRNAVTIKQLLDLMDVTAPSERTRMQGTLGKVLGVLGWTKARRQVESVRGRFYVRPACGANDTGPTDDEILADLHSTAEPDDGMAEVLSMV